MPSDSTPKPEAAEQPSGSANIPPNGPDYGSAPPFTQPPPYGAPPFPGMPPFAGMPFAGMPFAGMPFGAGMPPWPMPGYAHPGYAGPGYAAPGYGPPGYGAPGYPGPGYPGPGYPGIDSMMSQMMDRAAFLHRFMITMSNMTAEISRACQLLAQNPSHIGMPFSGPTAPPATPGAATPADKPVDMEALKQALSGMDPIQAQKTLYAVQMMQWCASMMRPGYPAAGAAPDANKGWS